MFQEISQCPECKASYSPSEEGPLYCAQCRFPLKLIAHKYRLLGPIAEGGFGTIYRAAHIYLESDRERAIKILKAHVLQSPENIERFYREVRVTMSLSQRNEHIVRIYDDFGQDPDLGFFYVMEHLRGRPLSAVLGRGGLPLTFVLDVGWQVCDAIATCHRASVVHRDLKPENIFLAVREGHEAFVKVLDFGIAKTMIDTQAPHLTQGILGTPIYMSPEQAQGSGIGPASDVYALGIILYEMLAGMPPFGYPSPNQQGSFMEMLRAHTSVKPPPIRERCRDVPEELARWIDQMLAKSPEDRPASMEMLRDAFRSLYRRFGGTTTGTHTQVTEEDLAMTDVRGFSYPVEGLPSSAHSSEDSAIREAVIAPLRSGDLAPRVPAMSIASPKAQIMPFLDAPKSSQKLSSATPKAQPLSFESNSALKSPKKRRFWPWVVGFLCIVGVGLLLLVVDEIWDWIGWQPTPSPARTAILSQRSAPLNDPSPNRSPAPLNEPSPNRSPDRLNEPSPNRSPATLPSLAQRPSHRPKPSVQVETTSPIKRPNDRPKQPVKNQDANKNAQQAENQDKKATEYAQRPERREHKPSGGPQGFDDMGAGALEKVAGKLRQMGQAKRRMEESSRKGDLLGTLQGAKQMLGHAMEFLPPAKRGAVQPTSARREVPNPSTQQKKTVSQPSNSPTQQEHIVPKPSNHPPQQEHIAPKPSNNPTQQEHIVPQTPNTRTEEAAYRAAKLRLAEVMRFRIETRYPYLAQYQTLFESLQQFTASEVVDKLRKSGYTGGSCVLSLQAAGYAFVGKQVVAAYKELHSFRDLSVVERERLRRIVTGQAKAAFRVAQQMAEVAAQGLIGYPQGTCFLDTKRRQRSLQAFLLHPQHAMFR